MAPNSKSLVALSVLWAAVLGGLFTPTSAQALVAPTQLTSSAAPCEDVVFIGARGSGQSATEGRGLGPQVDDALTAYATEVSNRRVAYWPVVFPAQSVDLLRANPAMYFQGLDQGITDVLGLLKNRASRCPSERYVLAGYSQGAMVVHRALTRLQQTKVSAARIDGAILIADGDRQRSRSEISVGTAGTGGYGITWVLAAVAQAFTTNDASSAKLATNLAIKTYSICDLGDAVCDASRTDLAYGTEIHGTHYLGTPDVNSAAATIAQTSMAHAAVPAMQLSPVSLANMTVGQSVNTYFTASGGKAPYRYQVAVGTLPTGLRLSANLGLMSGKPTKAGTYVFKILATDANKQTLGQEYSLVVQQTQSPQPSTHGAFTSVSASGDTTCAADDSGAVFCWGSNSYGQLGQGYVSNPVGSPVKVLGITGSVRQVDLYRGYGCGLTTSQDVYCWGSPPAPTSQSQPTIATRVMGLPAGATSVAVGSTDACVLTVTGEVACWGNRPSFGADGSYSLTYEAEPWTISLPGPAALLANGDLNACASLQSGDLYCWGLNDYGGLGDGTHTSTETPVKVVGMSGGVTDISLEGQQACVSTESGNFYCWGYNDPSGVNYERPVNSAAPVLLAGNMSPTGPIDASFDDCATTSALGVACWGSNGAGGLGSSIGAGTGVQQTAVPVQGLPNLVSDLSGGDSHTCALLADGSVYCWGENNQGQLGIGYVSGTYNVFLPARVS